MARAHEPWFEYLLRNKAIRNFLSNYAESDWNEVAKLALLYGILGFASVGSQAILPIERLRDVVASGAAAATLEGALPGLNSKIEDLREQLGNIALETKGQNSPPARYNGKRVSYDGEIAAERQEATARGELAAANVALRHAGRWLKYHDDGLTVDPQQMPRRLISKAVKATTAERAISPALRAPSDWRLGDPERTYSPPGKKRSPGRPGDKLMSGALYPSWWGDGEQWRDERATSGCGDEWGGGRANPQQRAQGQGDEDARAPRSRSAPRPDRRPPRLAYSVQLEPGMPLWQNDLVTSRYLDVPSSGYGRAASPNRVPAQYQYLPPNPFQGAPVPGPPAAAGYGPAVANQHPAATSALPQQQPTQAGVRPYGMAGPYGGGGGGGAAAPGPQLYVMHPTGAMLPAGGRHQQREHAQQQQQQQQQGPAAGRPAWKPIRTAKGPSGAQSRIREQVRADREAARQRAEARQRAAQAAAAGGAASAVRNGFVQSGAPPQDYSRQGAGAPADIADALAANPYTAWFIDPQQQQGDAEVQQQQQQNQPEQQPFVHQSPRQSPSQQQQQHPFELDPVWGQQTLRGPSPPSPFLASPPQPGPAPAYPPVPAAGSQQPDHGQSSGGLSYSPVAAAAPEPYGLLHGPYRDWFVDEALGGDGGNGPGGGIAARRVAWADRMSAGPMAASSWLGPAGGREGAAPGLWQQQQPPQQQQPQQGWGRELPPQQGQSGGWGAAADALGRAWGEGRGFGGAGSGGSGWGGGWWGPGAGEPARQGPNPRAEALRTVRPEVANWSRSWVGDFGHLDKPPRDPAPQAAQGLSAGPSGPPRTAQHDSVVNGLPGGGVSNSTDASVASNRLAGAGSRGGAGPGGVVPLPQTGSAGGSAYPRVPPVTGAAGGSAVSDSAQLRHTGSGAETAAAALAAADALLAAAAASLEERAAAASAASVTMDQSRQPSSEPAWPVHASGGGGAPGGEIRPGPFSATASGGSYSSSDGRVRSGGGAANVQPQLAPASSDAWAPGAAGPSVDPAWVA